MTGINTREHVVLLTVKITKIRKSNYYKEACFTHEKDPRKLWSTINEVCSRKPKSTNVKNLEIDDQKLTDSGAMAEASTNIFLPSAVS